ncbi:MAG: methyltransferase family protein [Promethearchaeota archaeon]
MTSLLVPVLNFAFLLASFVLFAVFYTLSLQPVKRSQEHGDAAWRQCAYFRLVASIFESVLVVNLVLWVFFPIPGWFLPIFPEWWEALLLGLVLMVPFGAVMAVGMRDAGKETMQPSKDTKLYGGIYEKIRHPQTLGEFPMFPLFGLMVNSWTAFFLGLVFILAYTPVMVRVEEADLVRRFGEEYEAYRERVGGLLPRIRSGKGVRGAGPSE